MCYICSVFFLFLSPMAFVRRVINRLTYLLIPLQGYDHQYNNDVPVSAPEKSFMQQNQTNNKHKRTQTIMKSHRNAKRKNWVMDHTLLRKSDICAQKIYQHFIKRNFARTAKLYFLSSQHHFQPIINTISYSLNKGSLNDAKKKIRSTRPLSRKMRRLQIFRM